MKPISILICYLFLHAVVAMAQNWVNVGNPGFSAGQAYYTSLALDSSNTRDIAYQDYGNSGKATVMKYNGTAWGNVGNPGFSAGIAGYTSLALDSSNTPYIAYRDSRNVSKATVMKYNGTAWVNVGNPGFSAGELYYTSLALDSSNTPYIGYSDYVNSGKTTVMKYNGTAWVNVGNPGFSAGQVYYAFFALDSSNTPYIAYMDSSNSSKATVMKYNPSTYIELLSFRAKLEQDHARITWETAVEINNAGFQIWRSATQDGEYQKITGLLIPSQGGSTFGARYEYHDFGIVPGTASWYKLQDIDHHGNSTFHGPIFIQD